jgi:C-terminal processing protease CtpA/Prc
MEPAQTECMAGVVPPLVKRSGLYEVLAPPGPLGIVVDTTKDGPVIHSLKGTSTLLGLVGSGDLIVGLDDMDTRSMTAATLTRMMAKRSNQAERKITLLAVDN